jgi:erythronate-4-phosphate dehydrogenase
LKKITVIADEKIPFLRGVLEPYAEVIYLPGNKIDRQSVINADALLIRTRTRCDKSLLEGTSVQFIATATIGFDHIDTEYCNQHKIAWFNAPGCNSSSVQQYITAVLMELSREQHIRLEDKTIGIVGVGNVGSKVKKIAELLGMKVKINDPPRARKEEEQGFVTLDEILQTCDFITLHVPLIKTGIDKTFHLVNKELFSKMKAGAWLFNTSRGEVVETGALRSALNSGRLAGTVLDVWENEPAIDLELLCKAFISTPDIAGYSTDGKANGTSQVVRLLAAHFGLPLTEFFPLNLPEPLFPEIKIDNAGLSSSQVIEQCVLHTYPIMSDHILIQDHPETFEQQRGQYPVRREFQAYTVKLSKADRGTIDILKKLGFKLAE